MKCQNRGSMKSKIEKDKTILDELKVDGTEDRSNLVTVKKARRPVRKDESLVLNLSKAKRATKEKKVSVIASEDSVKSESVITNENTATDEEEVVEEMSTEAVLESILQPKKRGRKKKVVSETLPQVENTSTKVVFQYMGNEVELQCLIQKAKEAFLVGNGQKSSIQTLDLYVKPEDNAAYYVVNGKEAGKIELI